MLPTNTKALAEWLRLRGLELIQQNQEERNSLRSEIT